MKAMTLNETISSLLKRERRSTKEGYLATAVSYAAQRHMLILLSRTKKRKSSKYQLRLGKHLKEGKNIKEAHRLAKSEL